MAVRASSSRPVTPTRWEPAEQREVNRRLEGAKLKKAWRTWLHQSDWDWMVTLTFRNPPSERHALKLLGALLVRLGRKMYGRSWIKQRPELIRWTFVQERTRGGVIHFHGLIHFPDPNAPVHELRRAMVHWGCRYGWARLSAVTSARGAISYITKQVPNCEPLVSPDFLRGIGDSN